MVDIQARLFVESKLGGTWTATEFSDQVAGEITITYGKTDRFESARAPYATFTLITGSRGTALELNQKVSVLLTKTSGSTVVFRGFIDSSTVQPYSEDFVAVQYTATGLLAKAAQGEAGAGGITAANANLQVQTTLYEGLNSLIINALPDTIDDNSGTIDNWYGYSVITTADSPALPLDNYTGGAASSLNIASAMAAEALGTISERPGASSPSNFPSIVYYPYSYSTGNSFSIPASAVYLEEISLTQSAEKIINYLTLEVGLVTEVLYDTASIQTYGKLESSETSVALNLANKLVYAQAILDDSSLDEYTFEGVTIQLNQITNSTLREALFAVEHSDEIVLTGIPTQILTSGSFTGKVVGYEFRISRELVELSLNLVKG